jgi:hypothetical protein
MALSEAAQAAPPAPAAAPGADLVALRAEHDALASRLAARTSILEIRRASVALFFGFLGVGLSGKLGWDRWGITKPGQIAPAPQVGPPFHIWVAVILTCLAFALSIRWYLRAKRLLAEEDALFARFRELRAALGFEA